MGLSDKVDFEKQIGTNRELAKFFETIISEPIAETEKEMLKAADEYHYEEAAQLRDKLRNLRKMLVER